ncbi:NADH-quinone oxidoreductase subunit N [Calditrichota bacterium]
MSFNPSDLMAIRSEMVVLVLAMLVLVVELTITRKAKVLMWLTVGGLLLTVVLSLLDMISGASTGAFNGMIARDGMTAYMKATLAGIMLLAALLSKDYFASRGAIAGGGVKDGSENAEEEETGSGTVRMGEFYSLMLLSTFGMMILASATDLATIFLGIETMSIPLYILAGFRPERARSSEASLKYFLLGAFSTGFLLFGMALLYGVSGGTTNLAMIAHAMRDVGGTMQVYLYAGIGLMLIGLLFKVAAAPFHFWSPDVYQGSPTPVTAFMSAGPKAAAIIALIRLCGSTLPLAAEAWTPILWVVAALTMIVGNVIALSQKDIKRMLAYSSIAHAGYLIVGVIAAGNGVNERAVAAAMFYLTVYYMMNLGAFAIAILVSRAQEKGNYRIDDYKGLANRHPWLALAMTVFMVSLAGIPPTAGFFGKLYLFSAAVNAGFTGLVVLAVLTSAVSVFYYLRPVVYMFMKPAEKEVKVAVSPAFGIVLVICVVGILKVGFLPEIVMNWAREGAKTMVNPPQVLAVKAVENERLIAEK